MVDRVISDYYRRIQDKIITDDFISNLQRKKDIISAIDKRISRTQTGGGALLDDIDANINTLQRLKHSATLDEETLQELQTNLQTLVGDMQQIQSLGAANKRDLDNALEAMKVSIKKLSTGNYQIIEHIQPVELYGSISSVANGDTVKLVDAFDDKIKELGITKNNVVTAIRDNKDILSQFEAEFNKIYINGSNVSTVTKDLNALNNSLVAAIDNIVSEMKPKYSVTSVHQVMDRKEFVGYFKQGIFDGILEVRDFMQKCKDLANNNDRGISEVAMIDMINNELPQLAAKINNDTLNKILRQLPYPNGDTTVTLEAQIFKNVIAKAHGVKDEIGDLGNLGNLYKGDMPQDGIVQGGGSVESDMENLIKEIMTFQDNQRKYNNAMRELVNYTLYLTLITINHTYVKKYRIFRYINKGLIQYYLGTIRTIVKKIQNIEFDSTAIRIIRDRYLGVVLVLNHFLAYIVDNEEIRNQAFIDIDKCTGKIRTGFAVLNHFRSILDTYASTSGGKVSVYCRINDFVKGNSPPAEKWYSARDGISAEKNDENYVTHPTFNNKTFYSTDDLIMKQNLNGGTLSKRKSRDRRGLMRNTLYIKNDCNNADPVGHGDGQNTESLCFSETFNTYNYPDNDVLSSYMSLHTQISLGNGSAMLTYGYSGVGKTFTLFGGAGKDGIMQSTLSQINGLNGVYIRAYEFYGYGVPYKDYWKGSPYQKINKFNITDTGANGLRIQSIIKGENDKTKDKKILDAATFEYLGEQKIQEFISKVPDKKNNDYVYIEGDNVNKAFRMFAQCVEDIEYIRENRTIPSVKATPNNPISSRSMIVYDIQAETTNENDETRIVPFLIIDLPGRENIIKTFVETYMDKGEENSQSKGIKEYLVNKGVTNNTLSYKVLRNILSAAAINPALLPTFYLTKDACGWMGLDENILDNIGIEGHRYYKEYQIANQIIKLADEANVGGENYKFKNTFKGFYEEQPAKRIDRLIDTDMESLNLEYKKKDSGTGYIGSIGLYFNVDQGMLKRKTHTNSPPSYKGKEFPIYAMMASLVINRIISLGHFELLFYIIEEVINKILGQFIDGANNNLGPYGRNIKFNKYEYVRSSYEGIFINENIISLLYYLASDNIGDVKNRDELMKGQSEKLNNKVAFRNVRDYSGNYDFNLSSVNSKFTSLMKDYGVDKELGLEPTIIIHDNFKKSSAFRERLYDLDTRENMKYRRDNNYKYKGIDTKMHPLDFIFNEMKGEVPKYDTNGDKIEGEYEDIGYRSDRIYTGDEGLSRKILEPYVSKGSRGKEYAGIEKFKMFYLLSNNMRDLKCEEQVNLLELSKGIIQAFVPQDQFCEKYE